MSATVLARFPINPGTDLWFMAGSGNPNGGLIPGPGLGGAVADPAPGSIYVQIDGLGGNQLWTKEGAGNTWQLQTSSPQVVQLTASTTLAITQSGCVFECDATAGAFTLTLPPLASDLRCDFCIVKKDATANAITIAATGGDSIFGATSIASQGASLRYYAAPDGWLTTV